MLRTLKSLGKTILNKETKHFGFLITAANEKISTYVPHSLTYLRDFLQPVFSDKLHQVFVFVPLSDKVDFMRLNYCNYLKIIQFSKV